MRGLACALFSGVAFPGSTIGERQQGTAASIHLGIAKFPHFLQRARIRRVGGEVPQLVGITLQIAQKFIGWLLIEVTRGDEAVGKEER